MQTFSVILLYFDFNQILKENLYKEFVLKIINSQAHMLTDWSILFPMEP
jgi:hypothetical protein